MFSIIDAQLYRATQQFTNQYRNNPRSSRSRGRPSSPSSSQDSFASAFERLDLYYGVPLEPDDKDRTGGVGVRSGGGDGPIVATPMGVVRPWPRSDGVGGLGRQRNGAQDDPRRPGGQRPGGGTVRIVGEPRPRLAVHDEDDGGAGWVVSTPMGNVRCTRLGGVAARRGTGADITAAARTTGTRSTGLGTTAPRTTAPRTIALRATSSSNKEPRATDQGNEKPRTTWPRIIINRDGVLSHLY